MRRPLGIAAGLGLAWLALQTGAPAALAESVAPPAASPSPPPDSSPFDDDAAMKSAASPVASYTLNASLDPTKHTVTGKGTLLWRNASSVPQQEIWVHLYLNAFKNEHTLFMRFPGAESFRGAGTPSEWGNVTVTRLALEGGDDLWPGADKTSPGDPDDETDIRVPLPAPVAPGAEVRFDLEFESHLPSLLFRTGHSNGFYMVGQWFPKIARLEPDGRWAHFAFHHLSEFYADFGDYDVTVDTPDDMIVGATGKLQGERRAGGRVARRFVQASVHDFAFTAWSQFRELTATGPGNVAIRVLFPPGYDAAAAVELASVRFGLDHLGQAFGRYPYATLTVVHPPPGAEEGGGMEYPTLITTGGFWWLPWTSVRALDIVTVHELGHQWFYGLVATDEHAWPFLDEGVNSYAEADAMEALFPLASASSLGVRLGLDAINRLGASDAERNAPVAQPAPDFATGGDYGALVYQRTATLLRTLGNVYGADRVRRAVGRYARRNRFEHPGPDALEQAVREGVGDDAATQLHAALFDRATVDYTVADLTSTDDPERGEPAGGYHGSVLVRRRGALRFPVDVDLIGADGTVQRLRWDAAESAARLPYHGKSKLAAAVIDPEHRVLLDDDLSNNARRVSPSRLSGALLERLAFAVEAALAGVLPVTPDIAPERAESPAAHRRPGLVALAYAYRAIAGLLVALPAAAAIGGPTSSWPHGQSELFEPGGVMLVESLRLARRAIAPAGYAAGAIAAVALLAGVLPLGALLAGLARKGRVSAAFLAERAFEHAGTLALIMGVGSLAQVIAAVIVMLVGGKLVDVLKLASPADDIAFVLLLALAFAVACALGVIRDLAAVAAVRGEHRFYVAASRALRTTRLAYGRALGGWAWRAVLGLAGVVLAAWLAPSLTGTTTAAVALGVVLHQGGIAGATFAHASWLAAAMRLHDATEPVAEVVPVVQEESAGPEVTADGEGG